MPFIIHIYVIGLKIAKSKNFAFVNYKRHSSATFFLEHWSVFNLVNMIYFNRF